MRVFVLSAAVLAWPVMSWAQDVPVYQQEGNELVYTGQTLSLEDAIKTVGLTPETFAFEPPTFVANNRGTYIPVFVEPWEYESVNGADGIIDGAPKDARGLANDLIFDESEGLEVRDDLVFEENEGTNVQKTTDQTPTDQVKELTFTEAEGSLIRDEAATSASAEGVPQGLIKNAYGASITPQDGRWQVTILDAVAVGCPPGADAQARAQILKSRALNVAFSKPEWHPSDLSAELASYTWTKIGRNGYFSYPYTTSEEDLGSGVSVAVSTAYFVRTQTQIDTWYKVRMTLAPHLAAIVGGSEECEVDVLGVLTK